MPERNETGEAPNRSASQSMEFAGHTFVVDLAGALFWPAQQLLIVADMHLEKGSAFAVRGRMLPPYDTRETLQRLTGAIERFQPRCVIALGDSLHDGGAAARIDPDDLRALGALQTGRDWLWVTGNHDPDIGPMFGGEVTDGCEVAGIWFQHEPALEPKMPEIAGHLHPAARLSHRGLSVRRPCFAGDQRRLVMPAFGAFTGGLNVLDEAFHPLFPVDAPMTAMRVWMLGTEAVYPVPVAQLQGD